MNLHRSTLSWSKLLLLEQSAGMETFLCYSLHGGISCSVGYCNEWAVADYCPLAHFKVWVVKKSLCCTSLAELNLDDALLTRTQYWVCFMQRPWESLLHTFGSFIQIHSDLRRASYSSRWDVVWWFICGFLRFVALFPALSKQSCCDWRR